VEEEDEDEKEEEKEGMCIFVVPVPCYEIHINKIFSKRAHYLPNAQ